CEIPTVSARSFGRKNRENTRNNFSLPWKMQSNLFQFNEGKCVGLYLIDPTRTLYCNQRTLQRHLVAEGEDALDFDIRQGQGNGQQTIKVDLPSGVYVVQYSHPSFLQGLI